MNDLIREIHRRSLWQVLGIYGAASWGVLQVVEVVTNSVGLPDWTPAMALVLLLIGLPICVGTAFVQEGMPGRSGDAGEVADGSDERTTAAAVTSPVTGAPPPALAPAAEPSAITPVRGLLTWRHVVFGAIGAFALLGFTLVAYFVLWTTGLGPQGSLVAQGVFEEGETVVLADFEDATGAGLGDVTTDAIRVDLQQSSVLNVAAPSYVSTVLRRMGRAPEDGLSAGVAREVATREGLKAVIEGEVASVGSGFLLTASLVAAESGDVIRAFRVPVESEDDLLAGIDKLSQDIREKAGESLRSIKSGRPLADATTSSLAALRLLSAAKDVFDRGQPLEAIPLLEQALDIDPEFATAWRMLAVIMWNTGTDADLMIEASTQAYTLRRRLTEREAGLADAWYRFAVEGDLEAAGSAYRRLLDRYPDDRTALNNLGVHLIQLGRWADAAVPLEHAVGLPGATDNVYGNLIDALWNTNRAEEAWTVLARQEEIYPSGRALKTRPRLLAGEGRWEEARAAAIRSIDLSPGDLSVQMNGGADVAGFTLALGRYDEARQQMADARRISLDRGGPDLYLSAGASLDFLTQYVLEGSGSAEAALARVLDGIDPRDINISLPQRNVLWWMLLGGRGQEAEALFRGWEASLPPERRRSAHKVAEAEFLAWSARASGDLTEAARQFRRLHEEARSCDEYCLWWGEQGRVLDELGDADGAIEMYERHLDSTPIEWIAYMTPWTPIALERLGTLYAERGDVALARARLETLVARYEDGDGPFVAFVDRARASLAALDAN